MPTPVADQVVVITGGSSGIGLATAVQLGRRGATVVLAARGASALERAAVEVQPAGGRAVAVPIARQRSDRREPAGAGNLFQPGTANGPTGSYARFALSRSVYTRQLDQHPARRRLLLAGVAACALVARRRR